ncbi:MAG: GNAT family N-acetyltransferase [Gammaproteobacteria bacterium]
MNAPRYFRQGYREELPLPSGTRMRLRIVGPGDRDGLLQGFENLSAESRIQRWLYPKRSLSAQELDQLLSPENDDHVAIVAVELDEDGNELSGIGMARFVRVPEDPDAGEIAITIADAWQGLGIGRILLHRLLAAMSERGVARAVGRMHAENLRMRRLLEPYLSEEGIVREDSALVFEMPVPEHDDPVMAQLARNAAAVIRMFRLAAEDVLLQPLQAAERQLESLVPRAVLHQLQRKAARDPGKPR